MILGSVCPAVGQGCSDSVPALLDRIEGMKSETDTAELVELLKCLSKPAERWVRDYDSFASEQAMEKIEKETEPYRLRVYKILIPLSSSGDWLVADEAAAALVYYGYTPAGEMLDSYPDGPKKAVLYAIVGYKSSYRWAMDRILEIDRSSHQEDGADKARMVYLGLLYHLAEPRSLPFLNGLISSQENSEVRARAELVRERILKLNPQLK